MDRIIRNAAGMGERWRKLPWGLLLQGFQGPEMLDLSQDLLRAGPHPSGYTAVIRVDAGRVVASRTYRSLLLSLCVVNALSLLSSGESAALRMGRGAVGLASALMLWAAGERVPSRAVRRGVLATGVCWTLITIACTLQVEWPSGLDLAVVLGCYAVFEEGLGVGVLIVGIALVPVLAVYGLRDGPLPPMTAQFASGWLLACISMLFVSHRLARAVDEGGRELAESARVLGEQEMALAEVTRLLASDMTVAVTALRASVTEGRQQVRTAAKALVAALGVTRRAMPSEPELPPARIEDRLRDVRLDSFRGLLTLGLCLLPIIVWRNSAFGYRRSLVFNVLQLVLTVSAAVMLRLRPERWESTMRWFAQVIVGLSLCALAWWYQTPVGEPLPPNVAPLAITIVLMAYALGSRRALLVAGISAVLLVVLLRLRHPGLHAVQMSTRIVLFAIVADLLIVLPRRLLSWLEDARQAAVAAIIRQRRVIGTLFHDLGSPVQLVLLSAHDLAADGAGEPSEEEASALEEIDSMAARMQETLAAAIRGERADGLVSIQAVCRAVPRVFARALREKAVTLDVRADTNALVRADPVILRDSVLSNLVSNALKFSPRGGTITMEVTEGVQAVEITVSDRGAGLAADVQAALATGSLMPSHTGTAGEPGTGFGVRLVQDYVKHMRGTVAYEARSGGGVVVRVRLPSV
jgi:signal transduction histidine kinase